MLRKLRPRSVYDVCAALALFVALGGTAYAVNTVGSADIIDGEVKSVDIGNGEVNSADVKDQSLTTFDVSTFLGADIVDGTITGADVGDGTLTGADIGDGSLKDADIAPTVLRDIQRNIGVVPANSCKKDLNPLTSAIARDHMIVTASSSDAAVNLDYTAEYAPTGSTDVVIKVCNPTTSAIDDGITHFNLLGIDAQ